MLYDLIHSLLCPLRLRLQSLLYSIDHISICLKWLITMNKPTGSTLYGFNNDSLQFSLMLGLHPSFSPSSDATLMLEILTS